MNYANVFTAADGGLQEYQFSRYKRSAHNRCGECIQEGPKETRKVVVTNRFA